jgi:hypothetical protein
MITTVLFCTVLHCSALCTGVLCCGHLQQKTHHLLLGVLDVQQLRVEPVLDVIVRLLALPSAGGAGALAAPVVLHREPAMGQRLVPVAAAAALDAPGAHEPQREQRIDGDRQAEQCALLQVAAAAISPPHCTQTHTGTGAIMSCQVSAVHLYSALCCALLL